MTFIRNSIAGIFVVVALSGCLENPPGADKISLPRTVQQTDQQIVEQRAPLPTKHGPSLIGQDRGAKIYAPAGNDSLVQGLKKSLDAAAMDFSRTIVSLEATVNANDKTVVVSLQRNPGQGALSNDVLKGTLEGSQALLKTDDGSLAGALKCQASSDDLCATALVDILSGTDQSKIMARAVLRRTSAKFSFSKQQNITESENFKKIVDLFNSTTNKVLVESTEIASGISQVRITIVANDNEVIGLKGDLTLVAANGSAANSKMEKEIRTDSLLGLIDARDMKTDLQDLIVGATIVDIKNGKDITVNIGVSSIDGNPPQSISVMFSRSFGGLQ